MSLPPFHVEHPEDERYDEINIRVVERWKESELSGDEWRFSYVAEFKRKGEVVVRLSASRLSWLLQGLQWKLLTAGEEGNVDVEAFNRTKDKCDQPGCSELATIFYERINHYSKEGDKIEKHSKTYRQFCEEHSYRGDCALDDADHNYKQIENPTK